MSEEAQNCNHQCEGCNVEDCASRTGGGIEKFKLHELTKVKKTIAVISGKGGVGKSMVTSLLAVSLNNAKHGAAILDADVTGPSIPQAFGVQGKQIYGDDNGIFAAKSKNDISIMSANLLVETPTTPLIWRGPMIASLVQQMYTTVIFGEKEFLLIDMPPGTGDVPLTVFQSIHVDGVIVVASPQELVSMVVEKSVNMAKTMNIPILGLIENMAYAKCPHCGEKLDIFGAGDLNKVAEQYGVPLLGELPIDPKLARLVDEGKIEEYSEHYLDKAVEVIEKL
ncbi:MAG: Mrp/NBP35 family ATP-binding protein [Bacilli bacterium]|nr:Mrp/NBP35 family ATP-binding protein [Bacilli bacterium]